MSKLLKLIGTLLLVPGVLIILMIPVAAFDGEFKAIMGLILIGGMSGVPGFFIRRAGVLRERESELQLQMIGFVRTHDAFALGELAAHIGKPPAVAQTLLTRDIARYHLPLVVHRASGRYLRLDRLSQSAQVADRCQSCGGSIGTQIVFEGETLTCPYCSSIVQTQAAQQLQAQPGWAQQSAWPQPQQGQPQPWSPG